VAWMMTLTKMTSPLALISSQVALMSTQVPLMNAAMMGGRLGVMTVAGMSA
jgi:hypothetical protein